MDLKDQTKSNHIANKIILLALIIVGCLIRFWSLDKEGLRLDESQSVWQAMHSLEFIGKYMVKNVHLPLHNTLLHFWIQFFGSSEIAVRVLAVIPGVLSLAAFYYLAKEFFDDFAKLKFALFLAAVSPFWVWFSREIRMYSLLALLSTLSYLFFIRVLKYDNKRNYIFYFLVNLVGLYTHYYFALVLLVQVIFFFATFKSSFFPTHSKKKVLLKLTIVASGLVLALSPWVYFLLKSHGSGSLAPELGNPNAFDMFVSYFNFIFGFQHEFISSLILGIWPIVFLMGFVFLTKRHNPFNPLVLLSVLGTFVPVVLILFISIYFKPIYLTRYLTPVTPMLYILIVWSIYELKGRLRDIVVVVFGLSMIVALYLQLNDSRSPIREDYRTAVEYINMETTYRDIVLIAPPYNIYTFYYYYDGKAVVQTLPKWDKRDGAIPNITPELVAKDIESARIGHEKMYLLVSENLSHTLEFKEYMNSNFTKIYKKEFSKDLWLHVYQAEYE